MRAGECESESETHGGTGTEWEVDRRQQSPRTAFAFAGVGHNGRWGNVKRPRCNNGRRGQPKQRGEAQRRKVKAVQVAGTVR